MEDTEEIDGGRYNESDSGSSAVNGTPYTEGVVLRIRRHIPPAPFNGPYGYNPRGRAINKPEDGVVPDRVAFALDNPPVESCELLDDEYPFTITGVKTLRHLSSDNRGGPHVVTGYAEDKKETLYVAKIYDGVDYPWELGYEGGDCMLDADYDYALEAAAYGTMQAVEGVGKKLVPEYCGGWTFPLDTGDENPRDGHTLDYSLLPPEDFRLRVLKNLFEAQISIWWDAEVKHEDLEPRNVIVKADGSAVIVDFNQAVLYKFYDNELNSPEDMKYLQHPKYWENEPALPLSPIEWNWPVAPVGRFLTDSWEHDNALADWIPEQWLQDADLAAEWLLETWENTLSKKYRPLSDDFLNHSGHRERKPKVQAMLERLGRKPADKM
ncbi:uncharacterized protein C8A04DRAFT_39050 [Dichotomopilus funicola]|uniref:Uncharacterized protein n=1 Tax=Dichotomopilus funicola TaxID=1934379 RepID=A0AAN6UYP5_9PEZI|nr:hypothetical protein C8A04DRAFT_39050 [Dichotomopilus funicola]